MDRMKKLEAYAKLVKSPKNKRSYDWDGKIDGSYVMHPTAPKASPLLEEYMTKQEKERNKNN